MKRRFWIGGLLLVIFPLIVLANEPRITTIKYAKKGNQTLFIDFYSTKSDSKEKRPALIFVFGGGFYEGSRDAQKQLNLYNYMAKRGFVVAAIDYRLGLKGLQEAPSADNSKPLSHAVNMAVEDLFDATKFILDRADELNIDSSKIILSGSSAGGVTALTAEYIMSNDGTPKLPSYFNYAGVVTFSGAVFSKEKIPTYKNKLPAPTLMFHGTEDMTVPYEKASFNDGATMFGSKSLSKIFREKNYSYSFYSMEGLTHSVSVTSMSNYLPEIELFINEFVLGEKHRLMDIHVKDNDEPVDHQYD